MMKINVPQLIKLWKKGCLVSCPLTQFKFKREIIIIEMSEYHKTNFLKTDNTINYVFPLKITI